MNRTVEHVRRRHSVPMSSREEAKYERDEVEGPLKTSATGTIEELQEEDVDIHERGKVKRKKMTISEENVSHLSCLVTNLHPDYSIEGQS